jgi:hypothetical protein
MSKRKKTRKYRFGGVLGDRLIKEALQKGLMAVDPWEPWMDGGLPARNSSIDLRVGLDFIVPPDEEVIIGRTCIKEWLGRGKHFTLKPGEMFELEPGAFVVAQTLETVLLPTVRLKPHTGVPLFGGRFGGVSENARFGLWVEGAPVIHPSPTARPIALELKNMRGGTKPTKVVAGESRAGQLQIYPIIGPIDHRKGRWDGQTKPHGVCVEDHSFIGGVQELLDQGSAIDGSSNSLLTVAGGAPRNGQV